ncbi:hypothetical protein Q9Q95_06495 [Sphingomonas sp. DG1-23]|uniref:hypothetical protein n=1 Tax=Sphingomonas sp. DG1-23 TaxID=3068316 RepID=UPI00273F7A7D|nr:hypothetical protein [Sphingomonas sp. DG1-23]MDP5278566.1 hypothetical protein [Sphingomonas sp. DG1-23]
MAGFHPVTLRRTVRHSWAMMAMRVVVLIVLALFWSGSPQTRRFTRVLGVSTARAWRIASIGMVECVVAIALVAPPIA